MIENIKENKRKGTTQTNKQEINTPWTRDQPQPSFVYLLILFI